MNRWVVATASVIMMAGLGSFNAWSVFRQPLSEFYDANVTDINTAFFVSSLVFGLVASGSALLVSRVGPRFVGVTGAILYGLGVFLGSFADGSLSFLYVTYGFVAAVGLGLAIMAPIAALPRWFPERPGFAYGVAFVGFGIGPAANVPLMSGLLSATGGPLETFYVLGIIYAVSSAPPPGSCGTRSKIVTPWAAIWWKASRPYRIGTRRRGACGRCATP